MSIVIYIHDELEPKAAQPWDRIEWDEPSLLASREARGVLVKAVAQSLEDWVDHKVMANLVVEHRKEREQAKEEIATELSRQEHGKDHDDDIPF